MTSSLISTATVAQEWSLFPFDQKMFFTELLNKSDITYFHVDSFSVSGNDTTYYFLNNHKPDFYNNCDYNELLLSHLYAPHRFHGIYLDSILLSNDTIFYYRGETPPFYFIPSALVGESWSIYTPNNPYPYDTLTITCDTSYIDTVFGIEDSIKEFRVNTNQTNPDNFPNNEVLFTLSKYFGFLEFVPFNFFIQNYPNVDSYSPIHLLGCESINEYYGFRFPKFINYFENISVGDILFSRYSYVPTSIFEQTIHDYYRDSITEVELTPDSVIFTYDRIILYNSGNTAFQQDLERKFLKEDYKDILESPPFLLSFGAKEHSGNAHSGASASIWRNDVNDAFIIDIDDDGDTIMTRNFKTTTVIDTSSCSVSAPIDGISFLEFNSMLGLVEHRSSLSGGTYWSTRIIGYRIGDKTHGNIDFTTSVHENDINSKLNVYPNPTTGEVFVEIDNSGGFEDNLRLEIYNVVGELVLTEFTNQNMTSLNLEQLDSGIYFLNIYSGENRTTKKIVKQ